MSGPTVRLVSPDVVARERDALLVGLEDVLVDCIDGGASVHFLRPVDARRVRVLWDGVLDEVALGTRLLWVAEDGSGVVGTVQVIPAPYENQQHRGDLAKLLVHRRARNRGVAEALMVEAERGAIDAGLTLLVLDTASDAADRLYRRRGWEEAGVIPDYATGPDGDLLPTTLFFKRLA